MFLTQLFLLGYQIVILLLQNYMLILHILENYLHHVL